MCHLTDETTDLPLGRVHCGRRSGDDDRPDAVVQEVAVETDQRACIKTTPVVGDQPAGAVDVHVGHTDSVGEPAGRNLLKSWIRGGTPFVHGRTLEMGVCTTPPDHRMPGRALWPSVVLGLMPGPTSSDGFGETTHPRGQPDNAGQFRRKPPPTPPPASRQRSHGSEAGSTAAVAAVTKEQLLTVKVQIVDAEALSTPEPERMRSYLEDRGWELYTREGERPEHWRLPAHDGTYEVLLPSSKEYLDYPQRVSELLRTLSIVENRSELALWHELVS